MARAANVGRPLGAQGPSEKCQQQRYNAAAVYTSCQHKALGRVLGSGDDTKFEKERG